MWTIHLAGGPRKVNHASIEWKNKIISFGGYCSNEQPHRDIDVYCLDTDTYRWSALNTKHQIEGRSLPCQRFGHTVIRYNNKAVLWGGRNEAEACSTLYTFDLENITWNEPTTHGYTPSGRDGHTATLIDDTMYIFGGFDSDEDEYSTDIWTLHIPSMTWRTLVTGGAPPAGRDFHSATAYGHCVYFFGGRIENRGLQPGFGDDDYDNTIYVFDSKKFLWYKPLVDNCSVSPIGRRSHSAFLYKDQIFILGGFNSILDRHFNDLWAFCLKTNRWHEMNCCGEPISMRRRHTTCIVQNRAITFGGTSPIGGEIWNRLVDLDDLIVLDFAPSLLTLCLLRVKNFPLEVLDSLPKTI
ncbi:hypothetical protein QYM36_007657, partial [Artemia franciscana]